MAPRLAGEGIFATIPEAVEAAWTAFQAYRGMGLDRRVTIVDSIRAAMREQSRELARMAQEETGLGRAEDKLNKNLLVTEKTPGPEDLEPQVWTGDHGLTLAEYAPFGVMAAITPTTNPTATIINNTIAIVSAGNAVVFNVHPNAKRVSVANVRALNRAIAAAGGPPNLVAAIPEPTIATAKELMHHPRVRILLVTGGPAVVQEAMATSKRAITAGPGNPPVVVDETADLEMAGRDIVRGASFDNNVICTDEKEVFAVAPVADRLLRSMVDHGGCWSRRTSCGGWSGRSSARWASRASRARSTRSGSARTRARSSARSASPPATRCGWWWPTCRWTTRWCGPSR